MPKTATYHREHPGVDPVKADCERLFEVWAEYERVRSAEPSALNGSEAEINAAKSSLQSDAATYLAALTPEKLSDALRRGAVSQTDFDKVSAIKTRLSRENELQAIRAGRTDRSHYRER